MGKVREDNKVARWERWEGSEVARWGRREREARLEGGRSLILFKGGKCRVTTKFHLFVFDVNQGKG